MLYKKLSKRSGHGLRLLVPVGLGVPRRCSRVHKISAGLVLLLFCEFAAAIDAERLWLPRSDQKYYLNLVQSAAAAEALPRCQTVLEGTIDKEQSQPEHPIFRILCRQANGRSYNEMVDGLSFETLTTPVVVEPPETAEQLQRRLRQEQALAAAAIKQREDEAWQACSGEVQQQTALMMELVMITQTQPAPEELNEHEVVFVIDFDAENFWGEALRFRARCRFSSEQEPQVKIGPRR